MLCLVPWDGSRLPWYLDRAFWVGGGLVECDDVDASVEEERGGGAMDEPTRSSPLPPVVARDDSGLDNGAAPIDVLMRGEDGRLCVVG